MCKAMSEGGQRCASHTRARLATRTKDLRQAIETGDPDTLAGARAAWEQAMAEYASTTEGRASLEAARTLARETGDLHNEALMTNLVQRGDAIKAANREAASLLAMARLADAPSSAHPTLSTVAVGGGDQVVLASLAPPTKSVGLTRALSALDDDATSLASRLNAFRVGTYSDTKMSMADLMGGVHERVNTVADPESSTADLMAAVSKPQPYLLAAMHMWKDEPYSEERQQALMSFQRSLAATEAETLKMALDHPAATEQVAARAMNPQTEQHLALGFEERRNLVLEHPTTDDARLGRLLPLDAGRVSGRVQERIRLARMTHPRLALHAAAWDSDTLERESAFDQVVGMPLNSVGSQDRVWLAQNLDLMPTNAENRRTLARSVAEYAREYGSTSEANQVEATLRVNGDPEIATHISALAKTRQVPTEAAPERRGWFGR